MNAGFTVRRPVGCNRRGMAVASPLHCTPAFQHAAELGATPSTGSSQNTLLLVKISFVAGLYEQSVSSEMTTTDRIAVSRINP